MDTKLKQMELEIKPDEAQVKSMDANSNIGTGNQSRRSPNRKSAQIPLKPKNVIGNQTR